MRIVGEALSGVLLLEPKVFTDERGFFFESYNRRTLAALGIDAEFVQDNHSRSHRGVLRGIHFQIRQPQGKLVRVIAGEIFDVAVDLRKRSPTFGRWAGFRLSAENKRLAWIPPGFGHAFLVLSESAEVLYKTTDYYAPEHERTIRWDDPDLAIDWPLGEGAKPILSAKDRNGLRLGECVEFFE
jgi:dTDP-4-dehydrorhamnose 3,5-epimerase